jgi:squalene synthase HpnC
MAIESARPPTAGTLADLDRGGSVVARARQENFPVASRLLPARYRRQLLAIYGFARLADDIGDESHGDRLALLDWLEGELDLACSGEATHPVTQRLGGYLRRGGGSAGLEPEQFRRLIEANRLDQAVKRYATFEDLVGYCMLSAAPVGRLVLQVFGASDPRLVALSDEVCTGLQIVEHLQDVGEDAAAGRVYLPLDELAAAGCSEADLLATTSSGPLCTVVLGLASRARRLLASGLPLGRQLRGRPALAICGFAAGGLAAVEAVESAGGAVLENACRPRPRAFARIALALAVSASRRPGPV